MDRRQVYGGPSPPLFSQAWSMCTGCRRVRGGEEEILYFVPGVLLPAASSLVSLHGGASVQLRRGKTPPRHGDCDGGVGATARAS